MATALSAHFSLEEMLFSQTAARLGLDNTPDARARRNLTRLAATLELVRTAMNDVPLLISSGYRAASVNKAVGGAVNSAHTRGLAVDFTAPQFGTVLATARAVAKCGIDFDQVIFEYGRWVHLAIADIDVTPRAQLLSIGRDHVYVEGLRVV